MNEKVHYIGLDVHQESIAVSIAPEGTAEVRRYGIIGGTLAAVDKLLKKLAVDLWRWRTGRCTLAELGWVPA